MIQTIPQQHKQASTRVFENVDGLVCGNSTHSSNYAFIILKYEPFECCKDLNNKSFHSSNEQVAKTKERKKAKADDVQKIQLYIDKLSILFAQFLMGMPVTYRYIKKILAK